MKQRIRLKGRLKAYLQTALILGGVLAGVNIGIYFLDMRSGVIVSVFLVVYFVAMIILSLIVLAIPISQKAIATYNCIEIAQFENGQLYKENNAENFFFIKTNDWNPIKIIAKTDVDTEYAKEIIQQLEELERLKEGLKTFHQMEE